MIPRRIYMQLSMELKTQKIEDTDVVIYTDGSVGESNKNGGAGCIINWPATPEPQVIKEPCGLACSSYRAEMMALCSALQSVCESHANLPRECSIWMFTDSESTIRCIQGGPGVQDSKLADEIWKLLTQLSSNHKIYLQWIPGHKDIEGNEAADAVAKEAAQMEQVDVALDFLTVKSAVKGHFRKRWREEVAAQKGIYSQAGIHRPPALPSHISRKDEVTIHQIRTGRTPLVRSCWARYASKPDEERLCQNGCNVKETVQHLIWDCPLYST
jgi:ribonuclease HI